jgi:Glycosyltransferase family 87
VTPDARWRIYPLVVLATLLVVVVVVALGSDGSAIESGRLGGDLPEFVGAGRIVADGDAADLYEPARQLEAQEGLFGDETGSGILFAYPALLALPYALVSTWSFSAIYLLHTAVMVLSLVVVARLLIDRFDLTRGRAWIPFGLAVSLTFHPMFIGVFNGQTTALVLLGLVAVWVLCSDGRDLGGGVVAGLLLLKPQYGLLVIGLLFLGRRWRALAGAGLGGLVVLVGSTLVAGWGWFASWWELVRSLSEIDEGSNLSNEVSWLGLSEAVFGQGSAVALALGAALSLGTLALAVVRLRGVSITDARVPALALPTLLLVAPHSLFYDAGILVVALVALLPRVPPERRVLVAVVWWAMGFTHVLSGGLGIEPVAILVVGTWIWAATPVRRTEATPSLAT